jgi:hypothetical protein
MSPRRASEIIQVIAGFAASRRVEASPTGMNEKAVAVEFSMVVNEVQDKEYRLGQMGAFQQ